MPIDDFVMPTLEPIESPLPMALDNTTKTSVHRKWKNLSRDTTKEKIYENFHDFIEILGSCLKLFAESATHGAESTSHNTKITTLKKAIHIDIEEKKIY